MNKNERDSAAVRDALDSAKNSSAKAEKTQYLLSKAIDDLPKTDNIDENIEAIKALSETLLSSIDRCLNELQETIENRGSSSKKSFNVPPKVADIKRAPDLCQTPCLVTQNPSKARPPTPPPTPKPHRQPPEPEPETHPPEKKKSEKGAKSVHFDDTPKTIP